MSYSITQIYQDETYATRRKSDGHLFGMCGHSDTLKALVEGRNFEDIKRQLRDKMVENTKKFRQQNLETHGVTTPSRPTQTPREILNARNDDWANAFNDYKNDVTGVYYNLTEKIQYFADRYEYVTFEGLRNKIQRHERETGIKFETQTHIGNCFNDFLNDTTGVYKTKVDKISHHASNYEHVTFDQLHAKMKTYEKANGKPIQFQSPMEIAFEAYMNDKSGVYTTNLAKIRHHASMHEHVTFKGLTQYVRRFNKKQRNSSNIE